MESSLELITYSLHLIVDIDIPLSMEMRVAFFFVRELAETPTASSSISSGLRQPPEPFERLVVIGCQPMLHVRDRHRGSL